MARAVSPSLLAAKGGLASRDFLEEGDRKVDRIGFLNFKFLFISRVF